jgi:hypothetical protein
MSVANMACGSSSEHLQHFQTNRFAINCSAGRAAYTFLQKRETGMTQGVRTCPWEGITAGNGCKCTHSLRTERRRRTCRSPANFGCDRLRTAIEASMTTSGRAMATLVPHRISSALRTPSDLSRATHHQQMVPRKPAKQIIGSGSER